MVLLERLLHLGRQREHRRGARDLDLARERFLGGRRVLGATVAAIYLYAPFSILSITYSFVDFQGFIRPSFAILHSSFVASIQILLE